MNKLNIPDEITISGTMAFHAYKAFVAYVMVLEQWQAEQESPTFAEAIKTYNEHIEWLLKAFEAEDKS